MSQLASTFRSESKQDGWATTVSEERLLEAARTDTSGRVDMASAATGCPRFAVRRDEGLLTVYEIGQVGDSLAIRHRGEITKTARECHIQPGRVSVKYGFAGRVLLGPRGRPGGIQLPFEVRVADRDRNVLATQTVNLDVTIAPQDPVGYFSAVREISFNLPDGARPADYGLYISFASTDPGAG